jgi:UDP-glucose 4-epimerase
MGRRVLITGLATFWGGRLAQALEAEPDVDVIVGVDTDEPTVHLERTEYIRTDESYSILARIVRASAVDTVVHTFLVVDPGGPSAAQAHETNVIGTMNLCAAVTADGSSVRTLVVKSSAQVYGTAKEDPALFTETTPRSRPARHAVERALVEVEQYVGDLAIEHPEMAVSLLRFANVLGPGTRSALNRVLDLPAVPYVFGFDPLVQFVHEDDVVHALRFAMNERLEGPFNVAGPAPVPWSEVTAMTGKRGLPMGPILMEAATGLLRLLGGPGLTAELVELLRYGRCLDTRRIEESGFTCRYDTPGTIADHVAALRLRHAVGGEPPNDHAYDEEVETFVRHSPAVLRHH